MDSTFDMVEYFCARYSSLLRLTPQQLDQLQEEFVNYQLLNTHEIPDSVWEEALLTCDEDGKQYYRVDRVWGYISEIKNVDGSPRYQLLSKIARLVIVIPHSNAGEERVFNLIKQNKTITRSSLNTNGTLSSIIQVKLANQELCTSWEPPKKLLHSAKKATQMYNEMHKK